MIYNKQQNKLPVYSVQCLSRASALHLCPTEAISETFVAYFIRLTSLNIKHYNYFIFSIYFVDTSPIDRSPAKIAGSNPTGGVDVCLECCVLSGRDLL